MELSIMSHINMVTPMPHSILRRATSAKST